MTTPSTHEPEFVSPANLPDPSHNVVSRERKRKSLWTGGIVAGALRDSFIKLNPRTLMKNPVMFVVEIGSVITTFDLVRDRMMHLAGFGFELQITIWLWFTVLFANFAEAMAEGRGKAQADTLRKARAETVARRMRTDGSIEEISGSKLRAGDRVKVVAGEFVPGDGEVVEGVASVDESAITGESAPVIRESGGDRSAVTGGTRVLSDEIIVKITSNPGETFLDRMIKLVEGAERQKTPNEIALNILLSGLTIIFLLAVVTLQPMAIYSGSPQSVFVLISLLVCLIPTTIGGLLSAIGIAGMDRVVQRNVLAMSGRAVEAAGDVDTLLLDKTGTITLGNRRATEFIPAPGVTEADLADAAQLSSLSDETPEGRSIVVLAKEKYNLRGRELSAYAATFIPFTAVTRMSGVDLDGREIRKGAFDAIVQHCAQKGNPVPPQVEEAVKTISNAGGTPLLVAEDCRILGTIHLKDIIKGGMRERFDQLRAMGIRTVMITGDNPLTAAAIAREAGLDDFLAQAKPEDKLALIRKEQAKGKHEHRHPGRQGSRQHGGPRFQSDEADRGGRDRETVADHPRSADHIFGGQRRGEIFRHHPGDVCRRLPGIERPEHHGTEDAAVGDFIRRHFQRADHHRARAAGAARRALSPAGSFGTAALEFARLWIGRNHRAVYRNQDH